MSRRPKTNETEVDDGVSISAEVLFGVLNADYEYALIDVREPRQTADEGSLLLGVVVPIGLLETRIGALVPRRSTSVIVYDSDDSGTAREAARRLVSFGYCSVRVLDGGVRSWAQHGYIVQFGGAHVIGQGFGEWVESRCATPSIDIDEYVDLVDSGAPFVLLDSRPDSEFRHHSLPGAIPVPGAELVYRAREVVPSPDTTVVVHCAGRTRSILGAQSLIDAGISNRVVSLSGGTQAWELSGRRVRRSEEPPEPASPGLATTQWAREATSRLAARFGIEKIGLDDITRYLGEPRRTTYLFDVRTPEEFVSGHLPGTVSAPSWRLVPWVFRFVATRNSRIVLCDNDETRSIVVATWLRRLGWSDVAVLRGGISGAAQEYGDTVTPVLGSFVDTVDFIEVDELAAALSTDTNVTVLDVGSSSAYAAGHIPGAQFALRSRLRADITLVPGHGPIVLSSDDGIIAGFTACDLRGVTSRKVLVLRGGHIGWLDRSMPTTASDPRYFHPADDVHGSGWMVDDSSIQHRRFREYLDWELGLPDALDRDPTTPFTTIVDDKTGAHLDPTK